MVVFTSRRPASVTGGCCGKWIMYFAGSGVVLRTICWAVLWGVRGGSVLSAVCWHGKSRKWWSSQQSCVEGGRRRSLFGYPDYLSESSIVLV